jgi:hypothetical protein
MITRGHGHLFTILTLAACGNDDPPNMPDAVGRDAAAEPDAAVDPDAPGPYVHPVYQPTKFVTANAPGGGDGSMASPWTLAEAMAQAVAGDRVQVGPGVYTGPDTDSRYTPSFYPSNDGTPGNPIVFFAEHRAVYSTERSEIRCGAAAQEQGCPAIGVLNNSYVILDGFYVDEASSPSTADTGPVVMWGSDHCAVEYFVVKNQALDRGDNHNAIRLEAATDGVVRNNRLSGTRSVSGHDQNFAAIMAYDSVRMLIEHNEIDDVEAGMFIKGDHGPGLGAFTIRYNKITGARWSALRFGGLKADEPTYGASVIAHNIAIDSPMGVLFTSYDSMTPAHFTLRNNTFVDCTSGIILGTPQLLNGAAATYMESTVRDNLVVGGTASIEVHVNAQQRAIVATNGLTIDHNWYANAPWIGCLETWCGDGGPHFADLPAWRAASAFDASSTNGDPQFVDAAGGDHHLQAGSPARTAGTNGAAVGAYVDDSEQIGIVPF